MIMYAFTMSYMRLLLHVKGHCAVARFLSVRPSVTRRYSVETAQRIIKLRLARPL